MAASYDSALVLQRRRADGNHVLPEQPVALFQRDLSAEKEGPGDTWSAAIAMALADCRAIVASAASCSEL